MRVSINMGTPKWIVYNGNPIYKWMIWGTTILGNLYIYIYMNTICTA